MDPESQRVLLIVLTAGLTVVGIGTVVLFFVFRAFGAAKPWGAWHKGLMAALIGFIFLCCLALLLLARSDH